MGHPLYDYTHKIYRNCVGSIEKEMEKDKLSKQERQLITRMLVAYLILTINCEDITEAK